MRCALIEQDHISTSARRAIVGTRIRVSARIHARASGHGEIDDRRPGRSEANEDSSAEPIRPRAMPAAVSDPAATARSFLRPRERERLPAMTIAASGRERST